MKTKAEWSTEWEVLTYKNDLKDIIGRVQADAVRWAAEECRQMARIHDDPTPCPLGASMWNQATAFEVAASAIERGEKEAGE